MCLGVTAKVVKIDGQKADVEFDGVTQAISIAMTPQVKIGEYVMIHAGFAISIIDQTQAEETMDLFKEIKKMMEEEQRDA
ncbi:Hydrogenase isoenzymes formation protein HypC [Pelotomaculum schinkii]|uniref:Hydrogenase isoenzymes formation protein HypC n=1 Tax=Pelotomaculum schinkii TaxID=78350 RepID=A0A4Y7RDS5_9FIRM|nr:MULTISPECIES: HypC/HybG/HupF family hydrogenase formation chaperone [Pelotomaculum]TEB06929.1 Hydrogenase isoenzymes formation protein HypC [Pelotomaculum schinkii]TEB15442.1 Hydrogenase isoenzymes formation protein HypC [Pelotomaculum sp. FP]